MAVELDLKLHATQQVVYDDLHRYKVIAAGRQWGKSDFACKSGAGLALTKKDSTGMVVAPYAKQAYKDYKQILRIIRELEAKNRTKFIAETSAKWLTFELRNGSEIMMGSAENTDGLRGNTLDWVFGDEAAFFDAEVWEVLEPSLAKKEGCGWFCSTPNGKGWFWDLYNREQNDPEFKSFHFTTYDNPYIPVKEIERMRQNMPELMFRQEVMAEFLEGGIVFPHLKELMTSTPREPVPAHNYVTGADIASTNDFTVIKTFDAADNHEVNSVRLTNRDWSFIRGTIYAVCKHYNNAWLFVDKTGVGAPVVEDLERMDSQYPGAAKQGRLRVVPIVFSSVSKPQLYLNYIMAQENHTVHLLPDPVTEKEHQDFMMTRGQGTTGYMKYGAPKGRHDDCFTKGTLILTPTGQVPIEQLKVGDCIITRDGNRPIVATRNRIASVIDRYGLTGTPEHPIITPSGIVKLLNTNDTTLTYIWNPKLSCMEEKRIGDIRTQNEGNLEYITGIMENGKNVLAPYISSYGSILTETFQEDQSFTTQMVIPIITPLKISNVLRKVNTHPSTRELLKEGNSQATHSKKHGCRGNSQKKSSFVSTAGIHSQAQTQNQDGVVENVIKIIYENLEKVKNIVKNSERKKRVYNIQVAGTPEYFANGILVHNCVTACALAVWGLNEYGGNVLAGPYTQDEFDKEKKKQFDPSAQIDVDSIIRKSESKQIAGFAEEEDQNISPNYD